MNFSLHGCQYTDMSLTYGDMILCLDVGWCDLDLCEKTLTYREPYPDNLCMLSLHGQMQSSL